MLDALRAAIARWPLAPFRPRSVAALRGYDRTRFARDLAAGITVGVVALPLAMAFAIASGVKPEQGLFTAIIAGFLISVLGGSRVQIGGPAGAFIVVVYAIIERYGLANLLISTMLAGVLLFAMGLFKLGQFVRFVPVSIVIGFTNGIAVLIALSQVKDFLGLQIAKMPADFFHQIGAIAGAIHTVNPWAVGIAVACLALIVVWPKSYEMGNVRWKRWMAHAPGTIVALGVATIAVTVFELPVATIGTQFGGIPQALPAFALPAFSWELVKQLFAPTVTIALLAAIESLLCARVADNMIDDRHDPNQELMAQGVANLVTPLFSGIPATGTIARTVTNVKSGASTPVAGVVHAITVLAIVLAAAPLATDVPLAALAAILMFVAWNMGEWHEFAHLRNYAVTYRATLLSTFLLTVVFDLTVAVEVGLVMAVLIFIYRISNLTRLEPLPLPSPQPQIAAYGLTGALFFGSVSKIESLRDPAFMAGPQAPRVLVLDVTELLYLDTTGIDMLRGVVRQIQRAGATLLVVHAHGQPYSLLQRSGLAVQIGADNLVPDLASAWVRARSLIDAGPPTQGGDSSDR